MTRPARHLAALAGTLIAFASAAPAAQAKTYCVNTAPGATVVCDVHQAATGTIGDQLQAAITAAASSSGADTVAVGAGTYTRSGGFSSSDASTLTVTGVGTATVLTDSSSATNEVTFRATGVVALSGLKVVGPSGSSTTAVKLTDASGASTIASATIEGSTGPTGFGGSNSTGVNFAGRIKTSTVDGFGTAVLGNGSDLEIDDSTISGLDGVVSSDGSVSVWRSTVSSPSQAVESSGPSSVIVNSLLITTTSTGVDALADCTSTSAGTTSSLTIAQSTLVSPHSVGAATSSCLISQRTSKLVIAGSILAPSSGVATSGTATATVGSSDWDGTRSGPVTIADGNISADPQFVGATNYDLKSTSPAIDAIPSNLARHTGATDLLGRARVLADNPTGIPHGDMGAYEYQAPQQAVPDGNLLLNPGAELGPSTDQPSAGQPRPVDWTVTAGPASGPGIIAENYGGLTAPDAAYSPPFSGGGRVFSGGLAGAGTSAISQVTSLVPYAGQIDAKQVAAHLSGFISSSPQVDRISASATYLDAGGSPIGAPVTLATPNFTTMGEGVMVYRASGSAIPIGTRSIRTTITSIDEATVETPNTYNEAVADNFALTLSFATPTPTPTPTPTGDPVPTPPAVQAPNPGPLATPAPIVPPAPYTGLALVGGTLSVDAKGNVSVPVSCPAAAVTRCAGTVAITRTTGTGKKKKTTTLVSGSVTVLAGKTGAAALKLSSKNRKLVTKSGLEVSLAAASTDARVPAVKVTTTAAAKLKPAKPVKTKK